MWEWIIFPSFFLFSDISNTSWELLVSGKAGVYKLSWKALFNTVSSKPHLLGDCLLGKLFHRAYKQCGEWTILKEALESTVHNIVQLSFFLTLCWSGHVLLKDTFLRLQPVLLSDNAQWKSCWHFFVSHLEKLRTSFSTVSSKRLRRPFSSCTFMATWIRLCRFSKFAYEVCVTEDRSYSGVSSCFLSLSYSGLSSWVLWNLRRFSFKREP